MTNSLITYNGSARVGEITYNGWTFPPALHATAQFTPVLDDSGRFLKWTKLTLNVECILFVGAADVSLDYTAQTTVQFPLGTGLSLDATFDYIRELLVQPGKPLVFSEQGGGSISIQDVGGLNPDVDNGPKPSIVKWVPLTNKMARFTWSVEANFRNCSNQPSAVTSQGLQLTQMPYKVSFDVDARGLSTRTIAGTLELSMSLLSNGLPRPFDTRDMQKQILALWPLVPRFQRSHHFDLSADRKKFDFRITDTEIDSDEPFGPGCGKESAKISIRSQLAGSSNSLGAGGFIAWNCSLSGSITLLAGFPKTYAWKEITRLFNYVIKTAPQAGQYPSSATSPITTIGQDSTSATQPSAAQAKVILTTAQFDDDFFGREIGFHFEWYLATSLNTIFAATGMFAPVTQSPSDIDKGWAAYLKAMKDSYWSDGGGFQGFYINDKDDILVSLCQSLSQGQASDYVPPVRPKLATQPKPKGEDTKDDQVKDRSKTYIGYHSWFEIHADEETTTHKPLDDVQAPPVSTTIPSLQDFMIPVSPSTSGGSGSPGGQSVIIHRSKTPTYLVRHFGHAMRIDYPPDIPTVAVYGGQPVTKVGKGRYLTKKIGMGVDITTGKSYQIFGLAWEQFYQLPKPPFSKQMISDGILDLHV